MESAQFIPGSKEAGRPGRWGAAWGHGEALGRSQEDLTSFQAADKLEPTQIVKILTQDTPEFLVDQGNAKVAQLIVLEVFPTNEDRRPLFTLGIVSSIV